MKTWFGYDGIVPTLLTRFWNCVWLSLLFLLCCVPAVTVGMSYSALYFTVRKALGNERGYVTPVFFTCIRDNWRQTLPAGAGFAVLGLLLFLDYRILRGFLALGSFAGNFYVVPLVLGAAALLYAVWVFAYICRFRDSLKNILRNAAVLAVSHIFTTVITGIILAIAALICYIEPILLALLPALAVWLISHLLEGVFRLYMTEEAKAREDEWNDDRSDEAKERRERLKRQKEADEGGETHG